MHFSLLVMSVMPLLGHAHDLADYDKTPYGADLAAKVAEQLSSGRVLAHAHRDYDGVGLAFIQGEGNAWEPKGSWKGFVMSSYYDGETGHPTQLMRTWATKQEFLPWLAAQSDYMLSGADPATGVVDKFHQGNQRITRQRLLDFVEKAEMTKAGHAHDLADYDTTPYGADLAAKVAEQLSSGRVLAHAHRDYDGIGLAFIQGKGNAWEPKGSWKGFVMSSYDDGQTGHPTQLMRTWATKQEFVPWLAAQSDYMLSGADPATGVVDKFYQGNQRITRQRLLDFVEKAEMINAGTDVVLELMV